MVGMPGIELVTCSWWSKLDKIRNEVIRVEVEIDNLMEKMAYYREKWESHIMRINVNHIWR